MPTQTPTRPDQGHLPKPRARRRAQIFVLANMKGGTGKTTHAANLAISLGMDKKRVLLVDCDSQANLTDYVFGRLDDDAPSVADLLAAAADRGLRAEAGFGDPSPEPADCVYVTDFPNVWVMPAPPEAPLPDEDGIVPDSKLVLAEWLLGESQDPTFVLRRALEPLRSHFDVILIDTGPHRGHLTRAALAAADQVLVALSPDRFSQLGLVQLTRIIQQLQAEGRPDLHIRGALMFGSLRHVITGQTIKRMEKNGVPLLLPLVPVVPQLAAQAQAARIPIVLAQPKHRIVEVYQELAHKLLTEVPAR